MHVKKIRSAGVPQGRVETFVGEVGTLFYNHYDGVLRVSDGHTPGGKLVYKSQVPNNGTLGQVLTTDSEGNAYWNNQINLVSQLLNDRGFLTLADLPPGATTTSATAPASPFTGELWYDTAGGRIYVYYDDSWIDASPDTGYTLPAATTSTLGGVRVDGVTITIDNNGVITGAGPNTLGNLTVSGQTITGNDVNGDIVLAPNGLGGLAVDRLKIPVGTILGSTTATVYSVADLVLNAVIGLSTNTNDALVQGEYGVLNGIPAPWAAYQFETDPIPVLRVGDLLAGPGIPLTPEPAVVLAVCTGTYAKIVIARSDYTNLLVPETGITVTVGRATTHASMNIETLVQTDINFNVGATGNIITNASILPSDTDLINLGSPVKRFSKLWLGAGTLHMTDETLGTDVSLSARGGNFYIQGGAGFNVGEFTLRDNNISIANNNRDIVIGSTTATAYVQFNRPVKMVNSSGTSTFQISREGKVILSSPGLTSGQSAFSIIGTSGQTEYPVAAPLGGSLIHATAKEGTPALITFDSFSDNVTAGGGFYLSRRFRGTVASPTAVQKDDTMLLLATAGYNGTGVRTGVSSSRIRFAADEDFTSFSQAARIELFTQVINDGREVISAVFTATGLTLPASNTTTSLGITFQDNSRQTTAWTSTVYVNQIDNLASGAVTSIVVGTGLTQTNTLGVVGISATGVQNVYGTSNRILVSNDGGNNLTLTTPQDLNTSATVTFANLTVNNINVLSTLTSVQAAVVQGYRLALASSATNATQMNGGGITLGTSSFIRSILYSTVGPSGDYWHTDPDTGFQTEHLVATTATLSDINVTGLGKFGTAFSGYVFANAITQSDASVNSYAQQVIKNHSTGTSASSDFVAANDQGDDSNFYIDLGINSSLYADSAYSISAANDGYLFNNGGNLTIGTQTPSKYILFHTGGTTSDKLRFTVSDSGLRVVGVVTATTFYGNLTGNVTGNADTVTRGVYTNGSYSNPTWITGLAYSKLSGAPSIPNAVSSLTNDLNFLSTVTWSIVTGKPTAISYWSNDLGYITSAALSGYATQTYVTNQNYVTSSSLTWSNVTGKPTDISYWNNNTGYITAASLTWGGISGKPTAVSYFTNDSNYLTSSTVGALGYITTASLTWNNVSGKPTAISYWSNDLGYITNAALSGYATQSFVTNQNYITSSSLSVVINSSGTALLSYNSSTGVFSVTPPNLSSYATQSYVTGQGYITTASLVGYATTASLTWTNVSGKPTAVSYWTNDIGYITSSALSGYATQSYVTSQNYVTSSSLTWANVTGKPTVVSYFSNDVGYITNAALSGYATQAYVTSQGYNTTATVSALIANSLTNYATQSYVTTRGYITSSSISVSTGSAVSGGALAYAPATGVFTFNPATTYTLTTATASTLGGVKVGSGINATGDGTISVTPFNTATLVAQAVSVTGHAQPAITSVGTLTNLVIAASGTITAPKIVINDGGIRTVNGGTALTIDFATDSLILWTAPSGTAAITLQNYTTGTTVKVIIALTTTRDVTYGISSAALSSTGLDNFNGAGGGSTSIANMAMHLEYTCFSGVAAGCYVAVTVL